MVSVVNGIAGWSSLVARQAHNLKVVGSNPTPATTSNFLEAALFQQLAARAKLCAHAVENRVCLKFVPRVCLKPTALSTFQGEFETAVLLDEHTWRQFIYGGKNGGCGFIIRA